MAHILRLSVLFVLFVHSVHAMEQKDDILEALHKSGHQTITRCDIQPMTGRGSNTKSLHTIYLKWELLVCKELRDNKESTNLQALDPLGAPTLPAFHRETEKGTEQCAADLPRRARSPMTPTPRDLRSASRQFSPRDDQKPPARIALSSPLDCQHTEETTRQPS